MADDSEPNWFGTAVAAAILIVVFGAFFVAATSGESCRGPLESERELRGTPFLEVHTGVDYEGTFSVDTELRYSGVNYVVIEAPDGYTDRAFVEVRPGGGFIVADGTRFTASFEIPAEHVETGNFTLTAVYNGGEHPPVRLPVRCPDSTA